MVAPVNVLCSDLLFSHLALTFFLQNGRIKGDQKKAIRAVLEKYGMPLTLTMNQVSALLHCCHCYRIPPPPVLPLLPHPVFHAAMTHSARLRVPCSFCAVCCRRWCAALPGT